MNRNVSLITIYGLGHFYVDFICAFVLAFIAFSGIPSLAEIGFLVLLYNIIAFGAQPFFGYFIDRKYIPRWAASAGLFLATAGIIFFFKPLLATILLGVGNALYHVGGGIIALNMVPGKAKFPGMYVAPGAIGLFLGGLLGYAQLTPPWFIVGGTIITSVFLFLIKKIPIQEKKLFKEPKVNLIPLLLLLLLVSVCARALIGFSLNLEWKSLFILGFALTLGIAGGKFVGGLFADKFGFMNVGLLGLFVATPLLVFFQSSPLLVFIGAFAFNLVMPITLTAIAQALPNYKGFAFGLTTLSLVTGYLLFLLFKDFIVVGQIFTAFVLVINIVTLYFGLKRYEVIKNETT